MTTFDDVKVGDRVRLTHENGDLAEFTVTDIGSGKYWISGMDANTFTADGWQVEILEKPLPTKHGAMIGHPTDAGWVPYVYRADLGKWYRIDEGPASEATIRWFMRARGFVVLFEGIDAEGAGDE